MVGKMTIGKRMRHKPINTTWVPMLLLLSWILSFYEVFELNVQSKCMLEQEQLEQVIQWFNKWGLVAVMTTPPKIVRFPGSSSTRQSPRHRGDCLETEPRREAPMSLTSTYLTMRVSGARDIQLAKNSKYPIPLPPMSEDVQQEGALLGHIPNLKYQDYNL